MYREADLHEDAQSAHVRLLRGQQLVADVVDPISGLQNEEINPIMGFIRATGLYPDVVSLAVAENPVTHNIQDPLTGVSCRRINRHEGS